MFGLKMPELLLIFGVLLLLFGARKLPELGKSLGRALRDFKSGVSGEGQLGQPADAPAEPTPDKRHA